MSDEHSTPPLTALVIEDDVEVARSLAAAFALQSVEVTTAASLAEARERLAERSPDIVTIDLGLPDGEGIEIVEQLDQHNVRNRIVISGSDEAYVQRVVRKAGIRHVLRKPVRLSELMTILLDIKYAEA